MDIYVGNLPGDVTEDDLYGLFEDYGSVDFIDIHYDEAKAYAFVIMADENEAAEAIAGLHKLVFEGKRLKVHSSFQRPDDSEYYKKIKAQRKAEQGRRLDIGC